jgi:hypothetical protein
VAEEVREAVLALRSAGGDVTVLSHDPVALDDMPVLVVGSAEQTGRLGGPRLRRLALLGWRTLLRRTPAAALGRAVDRSPAARRALDAADVVVAADPDAIEAVWRHARRHRGHAAVTGVLAGVRAVRDAAARSSS